MSKINLGSQKAGLIKKPQPWSKYLGQATNWTTLASDYVPPCLACPGSMLLESNAIQPSQQLIPLIIEILIKKLGAYGIRGISGGWLTSFLTSRKQFCSVNGQKSEASLETCGIPQGSCLGPLLFIIYLNDFEQCLEFSRDSMYADDTHVTLTSSNTDDLLTNAHKELRNISEWMRINKISASPKKTDYMIFIGYPRRTNKVEISEPLNLNDSEIKRVAKTKSLGVMVDEGLNWEDQFSKVKGKISGGLKSLKN